MTDQLQLEIALDDDGTAELFATVQAGPFSGHSSAWFDVARLIAFGNNLGESFPLRDTLNLAGGFWGEAPGVLTEEHLGISFYPIGGAGRIGCHVRLASLQYDSNRPQSRQSVQVELHVTYAELQRFGPALVKLAQGQIQQAVLPAATA
jgi:hypothetical protein